jgi:chorismate dehydratase
MNVAPVYFGLDNGLRPPWLQLVAGTPSLLNRKLAAGELDISPVSSVCYARHGDEWLLLPGLSIACSGPVMSVLLLSRHPLDRLDGKIVLLSEESDTAAALVRLVLALNRVSPRFATGTITDPDLLARQVDAALVIGDRALAAGSRWSHFPLVWDLGQLWYRMTGLPFVFAVWAVRRAFARRHPERVAAVAALLRRSLRQGLANLPQVTALCAQRLGIPQAQAVTYYDALSYGLGKAHIKGMETFFAGLQGQDLIHRRTVLSFFDGGMGRPHRRPAVGGSDGSMPPPGSFASGGVVPQQRARP